MAVRSAHHTLCHFQYCSPTCVYEPTRRISRASRHHSQCTHFHPSRHGIVEGFPSYSNTASAPTGGVAIFTPAKFISPSRQPVVSLSLGLTLGLEGPLRQVVIKIGSTTWLVSKKNRDASRIADVPPGGQGYQPVRLNSCPNSRVKSHAGLFTSLLHGVANLRGQGIALEMQQSMKTG